jgi:hypothetical protein
MTDKYNREKDTCDICGITKKDNEKRFISSKYGTYQERMESSFLLGHNGEVWCPYCFKEKELNELFDLMDRREKVKT